MSVSLQNDLRDTGILITKQLKQAISKSALRTVGVGWACEGITPAMRGGGGTGGHYVGGPWIYAALCQQTMGCGGSEKMAEMECLLSY